MVEVNFPMYLSEVRTPPLTQWDYNQKLSITGLNGESAVYQVHFYNRNSHEAIRRLAYEVNGAYEVAIPNKLLQENHDIHAVIYMNDYETAPEVDFGTKGI